MDQTEATIIVGIDIGKTTHEAVAIRRDGSEVAHQRLANQEAALRAFLASVQEAGAVVVVVDQIAAMGTFPVAVIQDLGLPLGYLPGSRMRKVADTFPGETKTERRDARIIAEAGRSMPHTIRTVNPDQQDMAVVRVLCGRDDDLATAGTRVTNQLRAMLAELHPTLERVVGPHLDRAGMLEVLERWPLPADLAQVRPAQVTAWFRRHGARRPEGLVQALREALQAQTIVVPGTQALAVVLPQLVAELRQIRQQRAEITRQLEEAVLGDPLFQLLTSMPGFGLRTAARTLAEMAGQHFDDADALAAYAGVAPVTRKSGSSIRRTRRRTGSNTILQDAWSTAAFAALSHHEPSSRQYYDRKRAAGKGHSQAVWCLARRRSDVLFAMLRDGTQYQAPH